MARAGDDHQFLVVALEFFECVFAEIAGMGFFAVNNQHRVTDFVTLRQNRHIQKRESGGRISSLVGVEGAGMVVAQRQVIDGGVEVFGIDVGRGDITGRAAAFTGVGWIECGGFIFEQLRINFNKVLYIYIFIRFFRAKLHFTQ